jgi:putative transposase
MKAAGLFSIVKKKFRPQSSKVTVIDRENLLDQDFNTSTINEKWVADITYINTLRDGWCYLASVMDLHSKKIVGYSIARTMTTDLVIRAFIEVPPQLRITCKFKLNQRLILITP